MVHLEWLLLLGYIDSLFAERTAVTGEPVGTVPDTLAQLYLQAMRHHAREAAVLTRSDEKWAPMPDWRLDRQVIRTALYLQERAGVKPGDRVAIVSAQLRVAGRRMRRGVSRRLLVAADPALPSARLLGALIEAGPKVVFASRPAPRQARRRHSGIARPRRSRRHRVRAEAPEWANPGRGLGSRRHARHGGAGPGL